LRFIGNKELLIPEILKVLESKKLLNKNLTFFDAFCGTGAVSDAVKSNFNIIINDYLNWCTVYTHGRIVGTTCNFKNLGFNPFDYFNQKSGIKKGFFYCNYSPANSNRMYFSSENAGKIDYIRESIEDWRIKSIINKNEYYFLLASLIESISKISNTAGVYGAFLKHWDSRALKPLTLQPVVFNPQKALSITDYNEKIENIIEDVDCDVLYLDPPYTQNQYGTQYHILQTLVLNDNPTISEITGSRPTAPMRSDWSKDLKSHILFDRLISKTKAKYILFSYSSDGFMSKSFIEANMKRYGKDGSYSCQRIPYNKYTNTKSRAKDNHSEYLFYMEKNGRKLFYFESPLNYIGSKSRIINQLEKWYPKKINKFIDIFGGGFNVGINFSGLDIIYNDINYIVKDLVESFQLEDTYEYLLFVKRMIKKYNLQKENSESYLKIREYYNSLSKEKRDPRLLYTLILYGYNQQIRFNGNHDFNNPSGMRWFNDKVLEKFVSFSREIKEKKIIFKSIDYKHALEHINKDSFVYMDPPYLLTNGSYNDGKRGFHGWDKTTQKDLLSFADELNECGIKFMISYVVEHNGNTNDSFIEWVESKSYKLIKLDKIPGVKRDEILVINYG